MLRCFYALYTDGQAPREGFVQPNGVDVFLGRMDQLALPDRTDELFGPYANVFQRFHAKQGYLLGLASEQRNVAAFFAKAREVLLQVTRGVDGWGFDVLRLWPFPLAGAADALPDDFLAEDLFSVGFREMGEHGFRAETFGLAKLGQRELTFEFKGKELLEDAALFCGHLAEWIVDHRTHVAHGHQLAFGFDRVSFIAAEGANAPAFRGWHPPIMQRLLPEALFPGVGVLEAKGQHADGALADLTRALEHAQQQRQVLEDLDLTGDAPHQGAQAELVGALAGLRGLVAAREEPESARDSGWRFRSTVVGDTASVAARLALHEVVALLPDLVRYLALPAGVRLEWDPLGRLAVDLSRVEMTDVDDEDV